MIFCKQCGFHTVETIDSVRICLLCDYTDGAAIMPSTRLQYGYNPEPELPLIGGSTRSLDRYIRE